MVALVVVVVGGAAAAAVSTNVVIKFDEDIQTAVDNDWHSSELLSKERP